MNFLTVNEYNIKVSFRSNSKVESIFKLAVSIRFLKNSWSSTETISYYMMDRKKNISIRTLIYSYPDLASNSLVETRKSHYFTSVNHYSLIFMGVMRFIETDSVFFEKLYY